MSIFDSRHHTDLRLQNVINPPQTLKKHLI